MSGQRVIDRAAKCACALLRTVFSLAARFDPQCIACAALSRSLRPVRARGVTYRHFLRLGFLDLLCLGLLGLLRLGLLRLHRMRA